MAALSVNRLVLQAPSSAAGEDPLRRLAGTWSQEDADAFATAIAPLEQVDDTNTYVGIGKPKPLKYLGAGV